MCKATIALASREHAFCLSSSIASFLISSNLRLYDSDFPPNTSDKEADISKKNICSYNNIGVNNT